MGRSPKRRNAAKEYILANPTATNKEIAATLGLAPQTVSFARAELANAGLVPPAWGDHKSPALKQLKEKGVFTPLIKPEIAAPEGSPFDTHTTADLNAAIDKHGGKSTDYEDIDDGEEIDINKLKRILWRIAKHEPDNRIRTSAIWTLTRIQQDIDERPLGPGIPKSKQDIIDRVLLLFDGIGAPLVIECMNAYLEKRKGKSNAGPLSADTQQTESSPSGTPVSTGSDPLILSDDSTTGTLELANDLPTNEHSA